MKKDNGYEELDDEEIKIAKELAEFFNSKKISIETHIDLITAYLAALLSKGVEHDEDIDYILVMVRRFPLEPWDEK